MPSHSWEDDAPGPAQPQGGQHSWEDPPPADGDDAHSESDSDFEQITPGEEFVNFHLHLYLIRTLSARDLCIAMHWAGKSGIVEAAPIGFRPDAPTGHYQRHLNAVLPYLKATEQLYKFDIPSYDKNSLGRSKHELFALVPHEQLDESMGADDTFSVKLDEAISSRELPRAYFEHPVVTGSSTPVVPVSLFCDAVPYSIADTVIGFWIINEITNARILVAALRKKLCCSCGCRGWCTYHQLWSFLVWSFQAMAEGKFPSCRHDMTPWHEDDDSVRRGTEGRALKYRCCLLYIKGDWSEYASTVGLPSWQDGVRPCYMCNSTPANLYEFQGLSPTESPFRANAEIDYFHACDRCEKIVVVDRSMHRVLVGLLENDRRSAGNHGRCLVEAVPSLGLLVGDRLEPSPWLPDVGDFENVNLFPCRILFWRTANEYLTRHRNPIFSIELGITTVRSITVDTLHCIYLGVLLVWCRHMVWILIVANIWVAAGTMEEIVELSALAIRNDLKNFYRRHRQACPGDVLTHIGNFSHKLLGTHGDKKLKTKGAETWGFFLFLLDKATALHHRLDVGAKTLLKAGLALEGMLRLWNTHGYNVPPQAVQQSFDLWKRYCALTTDVPDVQTPKRHVVVHLLGNIPVMGNPHRYANWLDESLNKDLKKCCRTVSQATFEPFCFSECENTLPKLSQSGSWRPDRE
jgi:hypothetical protein